MTRFPTLRRVRTNRERLARFHPWLEQLESRTLLDVGVAAAALTWFQPASPAGQLPASLVGPFSPPPGPPPGPYPNILVNDPAEDGTSVHDTHSETSIMVDGSTVVSVYNDSLLLDSNHITGISRSTDGGASFTDLGHLPTVSGGDAGDPVLAHDNVSGRSYLATLSFNGAPDVATFLAANVEGGVTP